jgi:hypothetical protein
MPPKTKKKVKTGFCSNGQCEGTKPKSRSGKPLKICEFWEDCACSCHKMVTEMYEMAGMEREPVYQSDEYETAIQVNHAQTQRMLDAVAADMAARNGLSSLVGIGVPPDASDPVAVPVDSPAGTLQTSGTHTPRFTTTPTGKRARGQLEFDVLRVCDEFTRDIYEWQLCLPKLVAERIGKINDTEPPSVGAIQAVWDRWVRLEFASYEKNPVRFTGFKTYSSLQTLETLKLKIKRDLKRAKAERDRGSIRPKGR